MAKSNKGFANMNEKKREDAARKGGKSSVKGDYDGEGPSSNLSDEDRAKGGRRTRGGGRKKNQ